MSELIYFENVNEQYLSFIQNVYNFEEMCKQSLLTKDALTCSLRLAFEKIYS